MPDNTITNLYDAIGFAQAGLTKDYGFSALIRYKGKTILFDGGSNAEIFKGNCKQLGVDLRWVDFAVLSHTHFDHINGLDYLLEVNPKAKIYFPNDPFWGAPIELNLMGPEPLISDSLPNEMKYFDGYLNSCKIIQTGRFRGANVEYLVKSKEIFPGFSLIVTFAEETGYFSKQKSLIPEKANKKPDHHSTDSNIYFPMAEISILMETPHGSALVIGCGHSTLPLMLEEANKIAKDTITFVYGGLHLMEHDREEINWLIKKMRTYGVIKIAPNHCTGHLAFKLLQDHFTTDFVPAGLGNQLEF